MKAWAEGRRGEDGWLWGWEWDVVERLKIVDGRSGWTERMADMVL